jgi:elongation factor Ts
MTTISASAVSSLRARTGVSILACKEALEEAHGDEEKAIEILRKRGIAQAAKKAAREQSEGLVFLEETEGKAGVVLIRCETDFVARDDSFQVVGKALVAELMANGESAAKAMADTKLPELVQKLGENISLGEAKVVEAPIVGTYLHTNQKIGVLIGLDPSAGSGQEDQKEKARDAAMHAAAMNPLYARAEEVTEETLSKEREIWREQLKKDGKPEAMFDKIMIGKEKKFREENALLTQPFVKDGSMTVEKYLGSAKLTAYVRVSVA